MMIDIIIILFTTQYIYFLYIDEAHTYSFNTYIILRDVLSRQPAMLWDEYYRVATEILFSASKRRAHNIIFQGKIFAIFYFML